MHQKMNIKNNNWAVTSAMILRTIDFFIDNPLCCANSPLSVRQGAVFTSGTPNSRTYVFLNLHPVQQNVPPVFW